MKNRIKSLFKSEFSRNVLTLATGTTIAQAIPIAISPILTRLYTPEEFGILALFLSIVAILGSFINGKYDLAIMLPKDEIEALGLIKLSLFIAISLSLIILTIIVLLKKQIANLLNEPSIENWLLFIPFSIFFIGLYNSLNLFNTRSKKFREVAKSSIWKSSALGMTQVGLGTLKTGALGLISGQIVSYVLGNSVLVKILIPKLSQLKTITLGQINDLRKKYKKFPLFTLPGALLNTMTINSTSFLITAIFDSKTLGFYSMSSRVMGSPSMVIGKSISKVYFQQASKIKAGGNSIQTVFAKTFKKLFFLSTPIFVFLYFTVEPIFTLVFGSDWSIAGTYSKILIPLMAVRFISSSLSNTIAVLEKQEYTLFINLTLFITTIGIFVGAKQYGISFMQSLVIFSITLSLLYSLFIFLYYKLSCKS